MDQSDLDSPQNDPRAQRVVNSIDEFVDTFQRRVPSEHASDVLNDEAVLDGVTIGQAPERFIEENLVRRLADDLGYAYRPQPQGISGLERLIPDFTVLNTEMTVIGELKKPNKIKEGRTESVDYIDKTTERPAIGIATDGFTWVKFRIDSENNLTLQKHSSLRSVVRDLVRDRSSNKSSKKSRSKLRKECYGFVDSFAIEALL